MDFVYLREMANEGYGMGLVRSTSFGRKRVGLPNLSMGFVNHGECLTPKPLKRQRSLDSFSFGEKSALEDLPPEILVSSLFFLFFDFLVCGYVLCQSN